MERAPFSRKARRAITAAPRGAPLSRPQPEPRRFARELGAWLGAPGPEPDVVVSCRVRLARNVAGEPFVGRLDAARAEELAARIAEALVEARIDGETTWVAMSSATPVMRLLLRERHLISRDLVPSDESGPAPPGRGVAFGATETRAVMVNEEDHLRVQGLAAGFDLGRAWQHAAELDRFLEERLGLACSPELGYLTACPTNVGTGMRASVMLHLPALSMVQNELEKVFAAAQRTGLAVRGLYGEGSRAVGDFYQISNQVTLGRSEEDLLRDLQALVPRILEFERKVRDTLAAQISSQIQDRVARALGLLRTARAMTTEVALTHLSTLRLGVVLGFVTAPSTQDLTRLSVLVQKGHVQALAPDGPVEEIVEPSQRDALRAGFLRRRLAGKA